MAEEKLTLKIETVANARSLASFNKELRNTDNYVKALDKSLKTNGTSYEKLGAKLTALNSKLDTQQAKYKKLEQQLGKQKSKMEAIKNEYDKATQSGEKNGKAVEDLAQKYARAEAEVRNTENQMRVLSQQMEATASDIANVNNQLQNFGQLQISQRFTEIGDQAIKMGDNIQKAGQAIQGIGTAITNTFLPIAAAGALAVKSAIDFESSWTSVLKTTNGTEQQFQALQEGLLAMSETIPMSVNDLNELASVGSQLGVPIENLEKFTEVIANLGSTTNLSAEEGAAALAQFANITGMNLNEVENLGSAIVDLGNNFATNEATIVNFAQRLAGVGTTVGLSEQEILGFSTAMASVGINAEAGGTAFSTVMSDIQVAVSEGGESLEKFAQVSGISVDEFKQRFETDASGAILGFIEGLGNIDASGGDVIATLGELGFSETRVRDVLTRLAGNTDLVKDALNMSNEAWEENTALQEEAELRYATTASQMEISKNKIQNIGISIGQALLPSVNDMLGKLEEAVEWLSKLDPKLLASITKFATMAVGVGLLTTGFGKFVSGIGGAVTMVGKISKGLGALTDITKTSGKAISSLSSFTTKLIPGLSGLTTTASGGASALGLLSTAALPVAGAVAAAATAIYAYHEYNEAMNDSILKTTEEMSWLEEGFRKLNGVQAYSKEELEEMNLVYEDFNENISPEFQKKVEEMRESISNFNMDLAIFSADGIFSDEEVEKLKNNFNEGVNQSIENIKNRKEEVQKAWEETFIMDDNTIDNNEQILLNFWNRNYDTSITEIEKMQADVNELFRKRVEEGYQFTPEDEAMIREYYAKVHQIEIECMVNNQEEELFAKNKFKSQVATMDAESASKLGQERKKALENDLLETEAYYDTQIEMLETHYDEMTEEEKAAADIELEQLRSEKEAKVQAKRDEINAIYDEMIAGNENLKGVIDRFNLEVFEGESKACNDKLNLYKEHNANMITETETGTKRIYDSNRKAWVDVTTVVDEETGEITGIIETWTDENGRHLETAEGYNAEYKESTSKMAEQMVVDYNRMTNKLEENGKVTVDTSGKIVNANGQVIGSIDQVIDENGNLITSVKDVNGNPIDINDNTDVVISGLQTTYDKVNNLDGKKATIQITTTQKTVYETEYKLPKTFIKPNFDEQGTHGRLGSEQLSYINEKTRKSRGWELVDGPYAFLGSDSIGDKVLLGRGAAVTNNLTSTAMMMKAVQDEVASSINKLDFSSYSTPNSRKSRALQGTTIIKSPGTNLAGLEAKVELNTQTLATLLNILINTVEDKDSNLYVDGRKITSSLAPYMDIELQRRKNRR